MPRFFIRNGAVPGYRVPVGQFTQRQLGAASARSDCLNEAQAIARGRKLVATLGTAETPPSGPMTNIALRSSNSYRTSGIYNGAYNFTDGLAPGAPYPVTNIFTGDTSVAIGATWLSSRNGNVPQWAGVDFGMKLWVGGFSLYSCTDSLGDTPPAWKVQGSNTGWAGPWTDIHSETTWNWSANRIATFTFTPVKFRYIRYLAAGTNGAEETSMAEFMIQGYDAVAPVENRYPSVALTGANTPSPYVAFEGAPGYYAPSYPPWAAFDRNINSLWIGKAGVAAILGIDLGTARNITRYEITSHNSVGENLPSVWTLEGSNDNLAWTAVDTHNGQMTWSANQVRSFTVSSPGTFRYYRLNITNTNAGGGTVNPCLTELAFYGA